MSRLFGRIAAIAAAGALFGAPAAIADPFLSCGPSRTVTTRYQEQICYRGHSPGYAACRWVDRRHDVLIPGDCGPSDTSEQAWPAGGARSAGTISAKG